MNTVSEISCSQPDCVSIYSYFTSYIWVNNEEDGLKTLPFIKPAGSEENVPPAGTPVNGTSGWLEQ